MMSIIHTSLYIYRYYTICLRHNSYGFYTVHVAITENDIHIRCSLPECNSESHILKIHHSARYGYQHLTGYAAVTLHPLQHLYISPDNTSRIMSLTPDDTLEATKPAPYFTS